MDSVQRGGLFVALLEITGGKASIQVNGKTYRKNARLILSEVVFGSSGKHAYVSFTYGSLGRLHLFPLLVPVALSFFFCMHMWSLLHITRILASHVFCVFIINCFLFSIPKFLLLMYYGFLNIEFRSFSCSQIIILVLLLYLLL